MRKIYFLMLSMLCSLAVTANAQTLLDEDFEHTQSDVATTQMPDGWTAVTSYTGSHKGYRWTISKNSTANSTMSGYYYAYCDALLTIKVTTMVSVLARTISSHLS